MRIIDWSSDVYSSDLNDGHEKSGPGWNRFLQSTLRWRNEKVQAAACFFTISRFKRRARSESFSSPVLSSQLSRPPTCSTERRPWVDTRSLTLFSSDSEISVTSCRLGRKTRLVLLDRTSRRLNSSPDCASRM